VAKRIAIIEDEAAIRENYAAAIRREGYAVDAFEARQPALDAFQMRLPDLVLIDVTAGALCRLTDNFPDSPRQRV
jgi:two-component system OmpR family response regulator